MDSARVTQILQALAAEAPMTWDARVEAIDAVKHVISELSVLADLRAVQGKNKKKQSSPSES